MSKDLFANKSKSWDMSSRRVKNAQGIAQKIIDNIELKPNMTVMDFGAGTGLLSYFIAPHIKRVVAVDNSPSMLEMFSEKAVEFDSETEVIELDLSSSTLNRKFDGIISSMTIHHLENIEEMFKKMYDMLEDYGFIAIADLESEDGSFHSDNTGVFHFGFEKEKLEEFASSVGFKNIGFELASKIEKPHGTFNVFLMTAYKNKA